jgi:hypothetical protein
MIIKEQIKARAEEYSCGYFDANNVFIAYTKGAEDMLPVIEALKQDNARMREALERMANWTDEQASWQDRGVAARDISQKALNQK